MPFSKIFMWYKLLLVIKFFLRFYILGMATFVTNLEFFSIRFRNTNSTVTFIPPSKILDKQVVLFISKII